MSVRALTFPLASILVARPCLRALLVRRFFALLLFLRSYAPWPSSPVVRASGLSGLFEVWLALPECDVVSLTGRVSLRSGFAAGLPPAAFTSVYCLRFLASLFSSVLPLLLRPVVLPPFCFASCCGQLPLPSHPCSHLFFAIIASWLH